MQLGYITSIRQSENLKVQVYQHIGNFIIASEIPT